MAQTFCIELDLKLLNSLDESGEIQSYKGGGSFNKITLFVKPLKTPQEVMHGSTKVVESHTVTVRAAKGKGNYGAAVLPGTNKTAFVGKGWVSGPQSPEQASKGEPDGDTPLPY